MITKDEKGNIVIHTDLDYDGQMLVYLQRALSLAIEGLGTGDRSIDEENRDAIWRLSSLLRSTLLTDSQTNVGLGGTEYRSMKAAGQ